MGSPNTIASPNGPLRTPPSPSRKRIGVTIRTIGPPHPTFNANSRTPHPTGCTATATTTCTHPTRKASGTSHTTTPNTTASPRITDRPSIRYAPCTPDHPPT